MRSHCLFVYGTLLSPLLMKKLVGKLPASQPAHIKNYKAVFFTHRHYPGLTIKRNAITAGRVYTKLSRKQIRVLDDYEGTEYKRELIKIYLENNEVKVCWIYITKQHSQRILSLLPWDKYDADRI